LTAPHRIEEVIVVIVIVESVDRLGRRRSSTLSLGRTSAHVHLLLSELKLALPDHKLSLTHGETVRIRSTVIVWAGARGTAFDHIIV
jgi:hypothetical protein